MPINEEARKTNETIMNRLRNFIANPWLTEMPPYQVVPRVYYVGNKYVGSYLLDTEKGLVLIDCALQETAYLLFESIRRVGFDPKDITRLLVTHGHVDHCGAARKLQEYSGCEITFPKGDAFFLENRRDLILEEAHAPAFRVSNFYDYGTVLDFGNIKVKPVHTPGHTPGCTSLLITVENAGESLLLGLHGGLGLNGLSRAELRENGLPVSLQKEYKNSLEEIIKVPVDIVIPSHLSHYVGDYMALVAQNIDGSGAALQVPGAWNSLIGSRLEQIKVVIARDDEIEAQENETVLQ